MGGSKTTAFGWNKKEKKKPETDCLNIIIPFHCTFGHPLCIFNELNLDEKSAWPTARALPATPMRKHTKYILNPCYFGCHSRRYLEILWMVTKIATQFHAHAENRPKIVSISDGELCVTLLKQLCQRWNGPKCFLPVSGSRSVGASDGWLCANGDWRLVSVSVAVAVGGIFTLPCSVYSTLALGFAVLYFLFGKWQPMSWKLIIVRTTAISFAWSHFSPALRSHIFVVVVAAAAPVAVAMRRINFPVLLAPPSPPPARPPKRLLLPMWFQIGTEFELVCQNIIIELEILKITVRMLQCYFN